MFQSVVLFSTRLNLHLVHCLSVRCSKSEKLKKMVENKAYVGVEENPPFVYVTTVSPETERSDQYIPTQPQEEWTCQQCTLLNPARKLYCIACFHRHPDLTPGNIGCTEDYDDDDDDDIEEYPPFPRTDDRQMVDQGIITRNAADNILTSQNILEAQAEEDPFHKKIRRRMRRKRRMIAGGAAGVAAGAVLGGPALVVAGMVGGVVGTRIVSKQRERLKDERLAMERYMMETKA